MSRIGHMGRFSRTVLTLSIAAVCAATVVAGAAVTNGVRGAAVTAVARINPPTVTPAGPLVNLTDLEPGDQRSTSFVIGNPNSTEVVAQILGEMTGGDRLLYDALIAEISSSDKVFWRGSLGGLIESSTASTQLAAGENRPVTLTLSVPPELGNEYQSRLSQFSLKFALDHAVLPGTDRIPPMSRVSSMRPRRGILLRRNAIKRLRRKKIVVFYGRASDEPTGVARVEVSFMRVTKRSGRERICRSWSPAAGKYVFGGPKKKSCRTRIWYTAAGTRTFTFVMFGKMLKRGRYLVRVRATDRAGNVEAKFSPRRRNVLRFRIR